MMIPHEIIKWFRENTYAVKDGDYWFITDFPDGKIPDNLSVPVKKKMWNEIKNHKEI